MIKADATGESERIRGAGDAERNRIFAEAFGQDPDFFAFYRSMQAYEGALKAGDTRLLLSPDSQFFQYFNRRFRQDRRVRHRRAGRAACQSDREAGGAGRRQRWRCARAGRLRLRRRRRLSATCRLASSSAASAAGPLG